jgi:hypothetical protein
MSNRIQASSAASIPTTATLFVMRTSTTVLIDKMFGNREQLYFFAD